MHITIVLDDDRLTLANKVVLIVGAILWTLAAILTAILSVLQLKLINGELVES